MKRLMRVAMLGIMPLLFVGCGYQNAYLATQKEMAAMKAEIGSTVPLYLPMWTNRTNELGLQLSFVNALYTLFQSSDLVKLTKTSGQAEYALNGEILSITQGASRGIVLLTVAYNLKDLKSGKMVWQVPGQSFSESYYADPTNAAKAQTNKRTALETIANDLAESIYMRTLQSIRDSRRAAAAAARASAAAPAPDAAAAPNAPVKAEAAPAPAGTESQPSR